MDLFRLKARAVAGVDLSLVKAKAMERNGWSQDTADQAEADYRRFLYLLAKYPRQVFVPWTRNLDLFWHEHILDTRRYEEDCSRVFGQFVHHDPHIGISPENEKRARSATSDLFRKEYVDGSNPTGPSYAWMIPGAAALSSLGLTQAAEAKQKRKDGGSSDGSSGCSSYVAPTAADSSCPSHGSSGHGHSCSTTSCGSSCGSSCGGGGCGGC